MRRAIISPVQKNIRQRDLCGNVCRQNNDNGGLLKCAQNKIPTNTLKEALRNRPPVADFINENEAQQIYREILEVVQANSHSSLLGENGWVWRAL